MPGRLVRVLARAARAARLPAVLHVWLCVIGTVLHTLNSFPLHINVPAALRALRVAGLRVLVGPALDAARLVAVGHGQHGARAARRARRGVVAVLARHAAVLALLQPGQAAAAPDGEAVFLYDLLVGWALFALIQAVRVGVLVVRGAAPDALAAVRAGRVAARALGADFCIYGGAEPGLAAGDAVL